MQTSYMEDYSKAMELLVKGRMRESLKLLKKQISDIQEWTLMDECMKIEEAYGYMLTYFGKGVADNKRAEVYDSLIDRVLLLTEKVRRQRGMKSSSGLYYSKLRTVSRQSRTMLYYTKRLRSIHQQDLFCAITEEDLQTPDNTWNGLIEELFDYIWVASAFTEEEFREFGNMYEDSYLPDAVKEWLVSALTLSLLYFYNDKKLELLVELTDHYDILVACRAQVGLSLVVQVHKDRFAVKSPHRLFDFQPELSPTWCILQMYYLSMSNTKRLRKQMEQDMMPLFLKMQQNMPMNQLQDLLEDEEAELPMGMDSELLEKVRNGMQFMNEKIRSGYDMYYFNFCKMKHGIFFNEVRNWFKPFSLNTTDEGGFLKLLDGAMEGGMLCDSDKYSLLSMLSSVPDALKKQMEQVAGELGAHNMLKAKDVDNLLWNRYEEFVSELRLSAIPSDNLAYATLYLQDIYRFFKIKLANEPEANPFYKTDELLIIDNALIGPRIDGIDLGTTAIEAYRQRLYGQAIRLFELLGKKRELTDREHLVLASCYAVKCEYSLAADCFEEVLDKGSDVSDDMLCVYAKCLTYAGNAEKALEIYTGLYEKDSPALSLYTYGQLLSQQGLVAEAQDVLFKEDYLRPNQPEVEILLISCLLHDGKAERALPYCENFLKKPVTYKKDYENCGHVYFALGRNSEAVELYRKSLNTPDAPFYFSEQDKSLLMSLGIGKLAIALMQDAVGQ